MCFLSFSVSACTFSGAVDAGRKILESISSQVFTLKRGKSRNKVQWWAGNFFLPLYNFLTPQYFLQTCCTSIKLNFSCRATPGVHFHSHNMATPQCAKEDPLSSITFLQIDEGGSYFAVFGFSKSVSKSISDFRNRKL